MSDLSVSELLQLYSRSFDQGDFHSAASYAQRAAEQAHQEGETDQELYALSGLARAWGNAGEIQKSIEAATRLLTRARETGNKAAQIDATRLLASRMAILDLRNRWHEIRPLLLEGLELARQLGNQTAVVERLRCLGEYAVKVGELDAGLDWLQQALSEAESLTDKKSQAFYRYRIHGSFSHLMRKRGNHTEAIRHAEISVGAAREEGNPSFVAYAQLTLSRAERARGELAEALRLVEEVLPQARQMGWKSWEQDAEYLRGELLREMGHPEQAEPSARRALELARETKLKEEEVECLLSLGQVLLELKRHQEAREVLQQARRLSQERDYADHFQKAEELLAGCP
jgi:tetratricopeptide (TPR) repeat protein